MLRSIPPAVFLILALSFLGRETRVDPLGPRLDLGAPAVPNEVMVRLAPDAFALSDRVLALRLGGQVAVRLPELNVVRLRLPDGEPVTEAVARIGRLAGVTFAEPNLLFRTSSTPNDPFFSTQSAYLSLIDAPPAWDIETGRDSVLVAVLDTGVDLDHEDLREKVWTNVFEIAGNSVDDDGNGCVDDVNGCSFVTSAVADPSCAVAPRGSVTDDNGHGTFVSGIIAARGNNALGVTGAAPGVTVLPVKILDCKGSGTAADAAQGLLYAARMGARVANISFGAEGESNTLANAIHLARLSYGMVIVAATGNEGLGVVSFPASLPDVIAVASSGTSSDTRARSPFSNWGPEVTIAAPGLNIVSTVPPAFCNVLWLCVQDQPYALASGTSFAAPLVSALAALVISHNPNIPADAVTAVIVATAEDLPDGGTPRWDGAGRIRMRAALSQPRYFIGVPGITRE